MRGCAQRWSPARVAHDGSRNGSVLRCTSISRSQNGEQPESEPDKEHQQLRRAGAELDDRHVLVAFMILIAGMLVAIIHAREVRVCPVSINALAVYVRALRHTGITVSVDVKM